MNYYLPEYIQVFLSDTLKQTQILFQSWEQEKEGKAKPETAKRLRTAINALELSLHKLSEQKVTPEILTFITNQSLLVETQLAQMMREFGLDQDALNLDIQAYQFSLKMTTQEIDVHVYNAIVNSISYYSNKAKMGDDLIQLYQEITPLVFALPEIKRTAEQYEVFKLLVFNYAIIATRTLDPERMEQGLSILVQYLPQEAEQFLKQGMGQMDIVGYPENIKAVMARFYLKYTTSKVMH